MGVHAARGGGQPLSALLSAADWPGLEQHFAQHAPVDADDFQARALLRLNRNPVVWAEVIADLQQVCHLRPDDPLALANLAQALLDAGRLDEAYVAARRAAETGPASYPALEKLAFASAAVLRWDEATDAVCRAKATHSGTLPVATSRLDQQLATGWWQPLTCGDVVLRQPRPQHQSFLERVFGNAAFMRHFHRFQPGTSDAVKRFIDTARQPPFVTRRLDWVVQLRGGPCIGLAGLVDIDWPNARAELLVGFPSVQGAQVSTQVAVAAIAYGFERLRFEKLVSHVYADNPRAQSNTLHLGFMQEGLLRSQIAAEGGRLDVFANGLLQQEYQSSALLQKLRRRWIAE
jgi:RimJ/RimL family protein N-acetyltransferase